MGVRLNHISIASSFNKDNENLFNLHCALHHNDTMQYLSKLPSCICAALCTLSCNHSATVPLLKWQLLAKFGDSHCVILINHSHASLSFSVI